MMKSFWDERFSAPEYIYGEKPNAFFAEQLAQLKPGKLLLPCEGEGRNAVFAAKLGWEVEAFDQSEAGCTKAMNLAEQKEVSIQYQIGDWLGLTYPLASFDAIALVFAHLPEPLRRVGHQHLLPFLKPGGLLILEGFNKNQIQFNSGGPRDPQMLFAPAELREDFAELDIVMLEEKEVELDEGAYHQGKAAVIRLLGRKP